MTQIERDGLMILGVLTNLPREQSAATGAALKVATQLSEDAINDPAEILIQRRWARWTQTLATTPYNFADIEITSTGRLRYQQLVSSGKRTTQTTIPARSVIATGIVARVETIGGFEHLYFQGADEKIVVCFGQGFGGLKNASELVGRMVELRVRIDSPAGCLDHRVGIVGATELRQPSQLRLIAH